MARDRGRWSDRQMPRRAEESVAEAADQVTVEAHLRRQPGKRGVGERDGECVSGQRHTGDDIIAQPCAVVLRQPLADRNQ